jgi:hypothetical protein
VDDGGEPVPGVALHPLPDHEDGAAGRVHQNAADLAEPLEVLQGDAESGNDDRVVGGEVAEPEVPVGLGVDELDTHLPHALVYVGVVDDLPHQKMRLSGNLIRVS